MGPHHPVAASLHTTPLLHREKVTIKSRRRVVNKNANKQSVSSRFFHPEVDYPVGGNPFTHPGFIEQHPGPACWEFSNFHPGRFNCALFLPYLHMSIIPVTVEHCSDNIEVYDFLV